MSKKLCAECGKPIPELSNPKRIYCSGGCFRRKNQREYRAHNPGHSARCTADTGAISEMLVTADLLKRGFEVFRAVSGGATCDMIALKNGLSMRIEVKTGARTAKGRIIYPKAAHDRFDHLAIVLVAENLITYFPVDGQEPIC